MDKCIPGFERPYTLKELLSACRGNVALAAATVLALNHMTCGCAVVDDQGRYIDASARRLHGQM